MVSNGMYESKIAWYEPSYEIYRKRALENVLYNVMNPDIEEITLGDKMRIGKLIDENQTKNKYVPNNFNYGKELENRELYSMIECAVVKYFDLNSSALKKTNK